MSKKNQQYSSDVRAITVSVVARGADYWGKINQN